MILAFTASKTIAGSLIRYGLNDPVSHFAPVFFGDYSKGLVVHQRFSGFDIDFYDRWLEKSNVVFSIRPREPDYELEAEIFETILGRYYGTDYDFFGLSYFAYRAAIYKFAGKPLPLKNKWSTSREPICTGLARPIYDAAPKYFSKPVNDFDMLAPYDLYLNLIRTNLFESIH